MGGGCWFSLVAAVVAAVAVVVVLGNVLQPGQECVRGDGGSHQA